MIHAIIYYMDTFRNREDAGKRLANILKNKNIDTPLVFALPRGGVVLGYEVSKILNAPLDIISIKKIGHPLSEEYAICAIDENGNTTCNNEELSSVSKEWLENAKQIGKAEAIRRRKIFGKEGERENVKDRNVIIVDDGVATGLSMRAAISSILKEKPKSIVVATAVIPTETANVFRKIDKCIEVISVIETNNFFGAIAEYYDDFEQLDDETVIKYLKK